MAVSGWQMPVILKQAFLYCSKLSKSFFATQKSKLLNGACKALCDQTLYQCDLSSCSSYARPPCYGKKNLPQGLGASHPSFRMLFSWNMVIFPERYFLIF